MNRCPVCNKPDDGDCCHPPMRSVPMRTPEDKAHARRLAMLEDVATLPDLADCLLVLHGQALAMGRGLLFEGNRDQLRRVQFMLREVAKEAR